MGYSDSELAKKAKEYVIRFNKYFSVFMADFLSKDVKDPKEKEALRARILSMKATEEVEE